MLLTIDCVCVVMKVFNGLQRDNISFGTVDDSVDEATYGADNISFGVNNTGLSNRKVIGLKRRRGV